MNDGFSDYVDDILPEEPNGELVQWMEPRPLSFGAGGISAAAAGAFALGVISAVAVLAIMHWVGPEREVESPRFTKKLRRD